MYHQKAPGPHQILSQAILTESCKEQIVGDMLINIGKKCVNKCYVIIRHWFYKVLHDTLALCQRMLN